MLRTRLAVLALGAALGACASDDAEPAASVTTRDQVAAGTVMLFDPAGSQVTLHSRLALGGAPIGEVQLDVPLTGGVVYAAIDEHDALFLDDLTLNHADVSVPIEIGYHGTAMVIGDLTLRVKSPVAFANTQWSDDEEIVFCTDSTAMMTIDWQVRAGGDDDVALAVHRLTAVDLDLMIVPDPDHLELVLWGQTSPVTWTWGSLELTSDLSISGDAFVENTP